jgi:uncharacterized protein with NRDE domain
MHDTRRAPDEALPSTGVSLELERTLSSMFIATEEYGTRCTTAILVDIANRVTFAERTYKTPHSPALETYFSFEIQAEI